jgi:hypothetical protein
MEKWSSFLKGADYEQVLGKNAGYGAALCGDSAGLFGEDCCRDS